MSEQLPVNPNQEQLFNPDEEQQRKQEARLSSRTDALFAHIADETRDENIDNPLSKQDIKVHEKALQRLDNGEIPESLKLKRDWSDTLAQHEEKQKEHIEAAGNTIVARLVNHQEQQKLQDRRTEIDRHNQGIADRDAEQAARKEEKEKFLYQQQLQHGENYMEMFADEMDTAANKHVADTLGPVKHTQGTVDIEKLKQAREGTLTSGQESQQKTVDALKDFRRGFSDTESKARQKEVDPRSIKVNRFYDDVIHSEMAPAIEGKTAALPAIESDPSANEQATLLFTPEGMNLRMRSVFRKMKEALKNAPTAAAVRTTLLVESGKKYLNDEEKGTRRQQVIARAAGAVAAFGAVYGAYKIGANLLDGGSGGVDAVANVGGVPRPQVPAGAEDIVKHVEPVPVSEIDTVMHLNEQHGTISHIAEDFLQNSGYKTDTENIYKLTNAILENQGLSYEDARHLPTGYKVTIPQEILKELTKVK